MKKVTWVVLLALGFLQFSFSQANRSRPELSVVAQIDRMISMEPEQSPEFPGGLAQLGKFINGQLQYPAEAAKVNVQGTVIVGFVVDEAGKVQNVRVLKGIGNGCDEEVVRVIKQMPAWKPGKDQGEAVAVSYSLPVEFSITHKDQQPK